MGPVLVENVMNVDEERAQVLNLGFRIGWVSGQRARELEKVEEERLDEFLELKCPVVVLGVFGGGEVQLGEVGDALAFEGGQFVVELRGRISKDVFLQERQHGGDSSPCTGHRRLAIAHRLAPWEAVDWPIPVADLGYGQRMRIGRRHRRTSCAVLLYVLLGRA